jgi:hypothetical protein
MPQKTVLVSVFDENNAEVSQMIFPSTWAAADALREMVREELRNRIRATCMEHGASVDIVNRTLHRIGLSPARDAAA